MKKAAGIVAIIALGISLTWAADQVAGWLGFRQQEPPEERDQSLGEQSPPGNGGILPSSDNATSGNEGILPPNEPAPDLSAEVASIEEDLERIEQALQNPEVLEEFTPSEPLSADNPIPMPTDI